MTGIRPTLSASFVTLPSGPRFVASWTPDSSRPRGVLVLLPPFGEELNKSRRTLAVSARMFARAGFVAVMADLLGCGDSPGEFATATWQSWTHDVRNVIQWAGHQWNVPVIAWAVRAGALFAPSASDLVRMMLLWQPVISGETVLTQLLRIRVANDKLSGNSHGTSAKELRSQLLAGNCVEIAGYEILPDLAIPMSQVDLCSWAGGTHPVSIVETAASPDQPISAGTSRLVEHFERTGTHATARVVTGDSFWNSQEIVENPSLASASIESLDTMFA